MVQSHQNQFVHNAIDQHLLMLLRLDFNLRQFLPVAIDEISFEIICKVCELYGCEMNCGQAMWKCDSGHEIFKHRYCDGEADCVDGSDEAGCESGCCDFLRLDFKNSAQT